MLRIQYTPPTPTQLNSTVELCRCRWCVLGLSCRLRCWQICSDSLRLSPTSCEFNTHRRRNSTRQLSCVGGVYWVLGPFIFSGVQFRTRSDIYQMITMAAILDMKMTVIQKYFGLHLHFTWLQKCRDSHPIHHHISLSHRVMYNKKTVLSQGNRAMPQLFFSV